MKNLNGLWQNLRKIFRKNITPQIAIWGGLQVYYIFNQSLPGVMIILIMWDMFETYSEPSDHWKLFFEITFSKTSAWKWIKIRFLAYYDFTKAITTFLSLETKSLDAYGQSIWQLQSHSSLRLCKGKVAGFSSSLNDFSVQHMPLGFPYLH